MTGEENRLDFLCIVQVEAGVKKKEPGSCGPSPLCSELCAAEVVVCLPELVEAPLATEFEGQNSIVTHGLAIVYSYIQVLTIHDLDITWIFLIIGSKKTH